MREYMTNYRYYSNGLYHHGIQGMKWGVRRFQNEDGSLTAEGTARYSKLSDKRDRQLKKLSKLENTNASQSRRYAKAQKLSAKAAKLRNKAYNGHFISNKKRSELKFKSERLQAKADKYASKTLNNVAKMRKIESKIQKYDKKMSKLNPNHVEAGTKYLQQVYGR